MGRQGGLVRLLESVEYLVDPDRFNVSGVRLIVLILAEQHNIVLSRFCLSGDLYEQVPALAHPDRPRQQLRADDADVAPLSAVRDHREPPAVLHVDLGTTCSAAGPATAALAAIVAVSHIDVPAVTAATAAAKVRFNFPPD
jgi:hypothetical protein